MTPSSTVRVRPYLFSSVFGVCSAFGMSTGLFKVSKRCFSSVLRKFQGYFKKILRVFQGSVKGVSSRFHGIFKGVSRKCQWGFEEVSRAFQISCMDVS